MIRLGPIERKGLLDLVDGDHEVAPGVTMLHAPGESPGHSVVRVESGDDVFYALGDLIHHPAHAQHLDWMDPDYPCRDATAMQRSRERVFAQAAEHGALLTYAHVPFPPRSPFGRVARAHEAYRWQGV